jgi:hypothetical protein
MSQAPVVFGLDLSNHDAVQQSLLQGGPYIEQEIERATLENVLLLERATKENTPVGVGGGAGLRGSIAGKGPRRDGPNILGVVTSPLNYAVPVELGTKPHMPPVQPLIDWAERKLDLPPQIAKRVGWAIAKSIAKRGTKGAFMFTRALKENEIKVVSVYQRALERAEERLAGGAS